MFKRFNPPVSKSPTVFDLPIVGKDEIIEYVDLAPELRKVAALLEVDLPSFVPVDYLFISKGLAMGGIRRA